MNNEITDEPLVHSNEDDTNKGGSADLKELPVINIENTLRELLFKQENPIVIAINGNWGEGKTFFWKKLVREYSDPSEVGYISVFGAESILKIRERVLFEALRHPPQKNIITKHTKNIWNTVLSKITKRFYIYSVLNYIGRIVSNAWTRWPEYLNALLRPNSLSIELLEENLLKPNWIVCLDDIERLSKSVPLEELLGYISELRDQFQIKVVLIYSNEKFEQRHEIYKKYQEKVIDRQLPFTPRTSDIIQFVFNEPSFPFNNPKFKKEISRRCQLLELKNIRILFKVKFYYQELLQNLPTTTTEDFLEDRFFSLLLFVYIWYIKSDAFLSFELLEDYLGGGFSMFLDKDDDEDIKSKTVEFLNNYKYQYTDSIDTILINFVKTDVLNTVKLIKEYNVLHDEMTKSSAQNDITDVWNKYYHSSLRPNETEFCTELAKVTRKNIKLLSFVLLDQNLYALEKLGYSETLDIFDDYIKLFGHTFNSSVREQLFTPIRFKPLNDYLVKIEKTQEVDVRELNEVLDTIIENEYLHDNDNLRIEQFTLDEVYDYFVSKDMDKITSKMRLLKKLGLTVITEVAEKLSKVSPINKMRMESMGLIESDKK